MNFGKNDFGTASATWRISLQEEFSFFANQKGLLYFNGFNWMRFSLHNRSEVRGVKIFSEENRVYVGGESEFGYFDLGASGNLSYHCLSDSVEEKYRNLGNLYDFYESHNTLYIHGDNGVLIKNGTKYSFVSSSEILYASTMLDGMIYLATDHGLKVLMGNKFRPIPGGEPLVGMRINCLLPYKGGLLVPTATGGLFYYDGKTTTRLHTDVDDLLMEGVICCADIKGDQLALGTIRSGLVILNMSNGSVTQYDESRGLQSNTIQSLAFDYRGNVWCGLDYGIDYVKLNFPFSYLYASPHSFGIGLDALCVSGGQVVVMLISPQTADAMCPLCL